MGIQVSRRKKSDKVIPFLSYNGHDTAPLRRENIFLLRY